MLTDRRGKALPFCSALAIATALAAAPQAARAQASGPSGSFQGTGTVVAGSAEISTGTNTTDVFVSSPQAVINWTTFDTATNPGVPINFQPAGTTATFQSSSDFAVLNRILPADASRPVQFNGTVISQIQSEVGATTGGTVYFYSPGGVIVGATAAFNVGNLGLTTSDPLISEGNFIGTTQSGAPQVSFTGANPGSRVEIQAGAQINALNTGSYVAAFAPAIIQNGAVTVNGRAAYVAGEAGTITFNPDGLYDIQVTTGTDGVNGGFALGHNGTTTGGASTAAGDNRRIYLVAVPKNQLITLAIGRGSSLGFDIAGAADVSGNAVILSAGHNVTAGAIQPSLAGGTGAANLSINDSNTGGTGAGIAFTSAVTAQASRNLSVDVFRQTSFASNASLTGLGTAQVTVSTLTEVPPGQLTINGNLTISAESQVPVPGASTDVGNAFLSLFNGGSANVAGNVSIQANASGFTTVDGAATGGTAQLSMNGAASLGVGGNLVLRAQGITLGTQSPISATGGNAQIFMNGASTATVGGVTRMRTEGVGGQGAISKGGFSGLSVQQGSNFTTGQLNVSADADGTSSGPAGTPGSATGGNANISVSGANSVLTVQAGNSAGNGGVGDLDLLSAEAFAGRTNASGGTGGTAQGGNASFNVTSGAVANLPVNPGAIGHVRMLARAYGGNVLGNGGTGGAATGGIVSLNINGGTLNSGNLLLPSSFAQGGSAGNGATGVVNGGHALGGQRNVSIVNGTLNGSFAGGGPGAQGGTASATGTGGNGTGGTANFFMDNATINATSDSFGIARVLAFAQNSAGAGLIGGNSSGGVVNVTIRNNSVINANGAGSVVSFGSLNLNPDATAAGAISTGDAAAGTVNVSVLNSAINAGQFNVYANALSGNFATAGGAGANARTGNASGGIGRLFLEGATITADTVSIDSSALAGGSTDINAVSGGNTTGGEAMIIARGAPSTINAAGGLEVIGSALTNAMSGPGNGGNGTGGFAHILADTGGRLTINANTVLEANGTGQSAQQSRGGDGKSGFADVGGINGTLTFNGDLGVHATGLGGNGRTAGNASATVQFDRPNALLRAQNGGVTVTGATVVSANSFGGSGLLGGAGGNAVAGWAHVDAQNNASGPNTISLQDLSVAANGSGGSGGTGLSGAAGGAGGTGAGGTTQVFGNAANGTLTVAGTSFLVAEAFGGSGGQGGANGGAGGAGGAATGGGIQFGTRSGNDIGSINTGSATFAGVTASTTATGGAGGAGGTGTATGNGGAGGAAFGGRTTLLVRGSPVRLQGPVSLFSDAFGGNGGAGAVLGAGGAATVGAPGGAVVVVTSRFQYPDQRGLLEAGDIDATALAIGGTGSVTGVGLVAGAPLQLQVDRADVAINSLTMLASGERGAGAAPSTVSIVNGVVDVADTLSLSTPGDLSVSLDTSTVNVANLGLFAGNFVLPAVRPTTLGTFNVSQGIELHSGLDFRAYANFDVAGDGFFDIGGSVETGDLAFDGSFELLAGGSVTTGAILAGGDLDIDAGGPVALGNLNAGQSLDVESDAALAVGNVVAGHGAYLEAGETLLAGNITAGSDPDDPEFSIGLVAGGNVSAGNLTGANGVGILSRTGSIAAGNVTAGRSLLALARDAVSFGSITTGVTANDFVYIANSSMEPLGGPIDDFDAAPIFAANPVALTGPITITGSVSTGTFRAATTQTFTSQAITAGSSLSIAAALGISTGTLSAMQDISLSSGASLSFGDIATNGGLSIDTGGSLTTGNVQARGIDLEALLGITTGTLNAAQIVEIEAGGAVLTGAITAGQSVNLDAGTTLTAGNIVAGSDPFTQFSVALVAGNDIVAGNLTGNDTIGVFSNTGSIAAGTVTAGRSLLALARGSASFGGITTGATANDFTYIANSSMTSLGGSLEHNFNPAPIFAASPIAMTGPITITGGVSTGNLIAATTGALSIGAGTTTASINLPGRLNLVVGGPLALGNVSATEIRLQSGSTINGGALTSREGITVLGAGAVTLGNLSAGLVNPTTSQAAREIRVASTGGAVTAGTVASAGDVRIDAVGGSLTTGGITAGDDVLLLARDSVAVGGIAAGTADGRITIASSALRGFGDVNDADPDSIFNATPIAVTGSIAIGGPVTGTIFRAAARTSFTAGSMTLGQSIEIDPALVQVNGPWIAPTISIDAQRIQFASDPAAVLGAFGTTQTITLRALASQQTAVLGGTSQGSGFTLTQADFARIRSTNLTIQVDSQGVSGTTPDLEIRDLTLNGSGGSGFTNTTITTPGRARVTGDLLLSQAGATDTLTVNANSRLEIVLPEGSIAIAGAGGALAGTLTLSSNNLVAGTLDILQQVMADPEAAGLVDALKTPASTTSNLNGYIRAEGVKLLSNANILLQNSGTARDFAGVTVGGGGLIIGRITPASSGGTGGSGGSGTTTGFSFTGMLATANEVLMFQFQVDANAEITLRTYSYAGGTNAAGQVIPAGGFDPILALFDAAGALIGQNDDGGSNVPADPTTGSRYDTFFQPPSPLAAGTYTVTVSAFPNFAVGPNLSNGFQGNGSLGGRTANFAFDVLGATSATGSGSLAPTGPSGPLNVIGFGRQQGANGQVITNNAFFPTINFGTTGENPLEYTATSQFNACIVGGECLGPTLEDLAPVDSIASAISVVTAATLDDSPSAPAADDADEGDDGSSEEAEDEDDSDPGASAITPPSPLINTRQLNPNVDVVEPVSGGGNPALLGSAVEENIVEGDNP